MNLLKNLKTNVVNYNKAKRLQELKDSHLTQSDEELQQHYRADELYEDFVKRAEVLSKKGETETEVMELICGIDISYSGPFQLSRLCGAAELLRDQILAQGIPLSIKVKDESVYLMANWR